MICINLVTFFCHSTKQAHNSSSISNVRTDILISIRISFQVSLPHLNPKWSSTNTSCLSSNSFSTYPRYYLCCMCYETACPIVATSAACSSFFKATILTSLKSLDDLSVAYMIFTLVLFILYHLLSKIWLISVHKIISCSLLLPHHLDSFFYFRF